MFCGPDSLVLAVVGWLQRRTMPPNRRILKEKFIPWRVPADIADEIKLWFQRGAEAEYLSPEWYEATEAIKSLPGYPLGYAPDDGDVLVLDIIDKVSSLKVH